LTPYRFWLLWTYTCFWSYTAYGETTVQENLWLVGLGYALVLGMILYEQRAKNNLLTGH
jgi:alpha-1,6-mannosyltransferase